MIFSVFQKNWVFGYSWSTLLWYRCYYPHRSRDSLSPVCGIFCGYLCYGCLCYGFFCVFFVMVVFAVVVFITVAFVVDAFMVVIFCGGPFYNNHHHHSYHPSSPITSGQKVSFPYCFSLTRFLGRVSHRVAMSVYLIFFCLAKKRCWPNNNTKNK